MIPRGRPSRLAGALAMVLASVLAVPPVARAAPPPGAVPLHDLAGLYPRVIRLAHNGAANGRILASVVHHPGGDGTGAIFESTDDGATFRRVGSVTDPEAADGRGLCCATLFELPRPIGALPAGTLLWAASVRAQARPMSIRIWRSTDLGRSWSYLSACATTTVTSGGLWEPEFSVAADGRLVCHYSDETDPAHSQKLMAVRSSDGVTWQDRRATVASPTRSHRPGMAVVRRLPTGRYLMAYEICGTGDQYGCAVHLRDSADGWNWGDPAAPGRMPRTVRGMYLTHTPTIAWAPSARNSTGKILLIGQLVNRRNGTVATARSGQTILVNTEGGHGYWYEQPAPVVTKPHEVTDPDRMFCPNYSSPLLPSERGDRVLEIASEWDGNVCKAYFASGSAVGTGAATGVVDGATYRLVGLQGGHCLDVYQDQRDDGANVQHYTCTDGGNQDWVLTARGGGYFTLRGRNSGKCLEVAAGDTAPGANVRQWTCTGAARQDWRLVNVGREVYTLAARHSGLCLDVAGGSTASGANVQQWTCNDLQPQIWNLQRR